MSCHQDHHHCLRPISGSLASAPQYVLRRSSLDFIPRLPVDVVERVLELVYPARQELFSEAGATLCSCALVCQAWRARAQMILFEHVQIRDAASLRQFAALLRSSGGGLHDHVLMLQIWGHLHAI